MAHLIKGDSNAQPSSYVTKDLWSIHPDLYIVRMVPDDGPGYWRVCYDYKHSRDWSTDVAEWYGELGPSPIPQPLRDAILLSITGVPGARRGYKQQVKAAEARKEQSEAAMQRELDSALDGWTREVAKESAIVDGITRASCSRVSAARQELKGVLG